MMIVEANYRLCLANPSTVVTALVNFHFTTGELFDEAYLVDANERTSNNKRKG